MRTAAWLVQHVHGAKRFLLRGSRGSRDEARRGREGFLAQVLVSALALGARDIIGGYRCARSEQRKTAVALRLHVCGRGQLGVQSSLLVAASCPHVPLREFLGVFVIIAAATTVVLAVAQQERAEEQGGKQARQDDQRHLPVGQTRVRAAGGYVGLQPVTA